MKVINELKTLLRRIGVDDRMVDDLDPELPLAGHVIDSVDYPSFIVAVEERYGVKIADRYSLKLRSLSDFNDYVTR